MSFLSSLKQKVKNVASNVKNVVSNVVSNVKEKVTPVANTVKTAATNVAQGVKEAAGSVANVVSHPVAAAKEVASAVAPIVKKVTGPVPAVQGSDTERDAEAARLRAEIENQKAALASGDTKAGLVPREDLINQAQTDLGRIEQGGAMTEAPQIMSNVVPLGGFGSTAGVPSSLSLINAASKTKEAQLTLSGGVLVTSNAKTLVQTTSWLSKLAGALKNPALIASGLVAAIGSYPFAGFIKEEALQTLGFGVRSAIDNNDIEGAAAAIDQQKELLDPNIWEKIIQKIPFANVVGNLKDFYDAASTKMSIDAQVVSDLKKAIETGETEEEKWTRIYAEQDARRLKQQQEDAAFWEAVNKRNAEAKESERAANTAYWEKVRKDNDERKIKEREAEAKYWEEYQKRWLEIKMENSPSNLKFGLL